MVRTRFNHNWSRRGLALLWDPEALSSIVTPDKVFSLRQFFQLVDHWPDDLPAGDGSTLVVVGLEGALDVLDAEDAVKWLETDAQPAIFSFQDFYEGQAGLVLWLPSGRGKISMNRATENYYWKHRPTGGDGLPIGRLLFTGAESEVVRLIDDPDVGADHDGKHWIGLHHPRIS